MSLSGFDQAQIHGLKRLLRALGDENFLFHFFGFLFLLCTFVGINLAPIFSRRATHLLCPSGTGLKFEKACQWGIPVVNVHWLVKMAESGQIPGLDGFLVSAPACDVHDSGSCSRQSLSPVKIDHEATKALQETISTLLGKRPTPEGEDLPGIADVPNGRNGKRARPHRSKVS